MQAENRTELKRRVKRTSLKKTRFRDGKIQSFNFFVVTYMISPALIFHFPATATHIFEGF